MDTFSLEEGVSIQLFASLFKEMENSTVARASTFLDHLASSIRFQDTVMVQRDTSTRKLLYPLAS